MRLPHRSNFLTFCGGDVATYCMEHSAHDRRFAAATDPGRRQALLCPPRLCRHHDQERRGGGRDFRRPAVQAFPDASRRSMPRSWRRTARPIRRLHRLLGLEPSTETLVMLIREMVRHFLHAVGGCPTGGRPAPAADGHQPSRRRRIRAAALREDRRDLIGPVFTASLERAVAAGDAVSDRARAAESVLVCPSHGADGGADAAAAVHACAYGNTGRSRAAGFANSFFAASDLTKPRLPPIWIANRRRTPGSRSTAESA